MQISADVFEGIIGHSGLIFEKEEGRRASRRVPISKRATIALQGSTVRTPATVVDLCIGGVAFVYATKLNPGQKFTLRVTGRTGGGIHGWLVHENGQRAVSGRL